MTIAVIVPVYKQDYIYALREQIFKERSIVDLWAVDNGNDYKEAGWEFVVRPEQNLRWTKGTNLGLNYALELSDGSGDKYDYNIYIMLNDDVILSPNFFAGIQKTFDENNDIGIVGPMYDGPHSQQWYVGGREAGSATSWKPYNFTKTVNFVDGTCLAVSAKCLRDIGLLDEENFGVYGFGADYDYCIRARNSGYKVTVTAMTYLNHLHQSTAKVLAKELNIDWTSEASWEMREGMVKKYGKDWESLLW